MNYKFEFKIQADLFDETWNALSHTWFVSKHPKLEWLSEKGNRDWEYVSFQCESKLDFQFVLKHLLPQSTKVRIISFPLVCKKCGKTYLKSDFKYKDPFLNRVCWCNSCKDQYASLYDGWRDDHAGNRFKGASAPREPGSIGITGKRQSKRRIGFRA